LFFLHSNDLKDINKMMILQMEIQGIRYMTNFYFR